MKYSGRSIIGALCVLSSLPFSLASASHSKWGVEESKLSSIPVSPGATRTTVTYGPFHVKAHQKYPHTPHRNSTKPCTDCFLTMMETRLEDLSGNPLDIDSGVWLHHLAQFNDNQEDLVCPKLSGHVFYGVGSELPVWRTNTNGKWGYYVDPDDQWVTAVEIVNEKPFSHDVQVSVTYEWIPVLSAEGQKYNNAELIYVNLGPPCGAPELIGQPGQSIYLSDEWVSTVSGPILEARGHMHAGGQAIALYVNGKPVCESRFVYETKLGKNVIPQATACHDAGTIEKGDKLQVVAVLDEERHKIGKHHGEKDHIMGIMVMYVGVGNDE